MKYKGVVFDFDGTIVDSEMGIANAFKTALKSKGIEEDVQVIKKLIGPPLSRTIITKYHLSEDDGAEAMEIHRKYYKEHGIYESKLFNNVANMLDTLKSMGIVMMIATNKPENLTLPQIEHFNIGCYFHEIIGNNDTQTRGSKADFIALATKDLHLDKSEILMVGDRYNDIEAGKEASLDTVGVTYGYGSLDEIKDTNPTYIVDDPMDIVEIVRGNQT